MFGIHDIELFIISAITLNLIPGSDTIFIVTRSIGEGVKAGIVSALGISTGAIFHILAASFGLSAIILSSEFAFEIVKSLGAIYLVYLGLKMILKKEEIQKQNNIKKLNLFKIYKQAILTNVLNPKVAIFFMALLPQFVSSTSQSKTLAFLCLGLIFLTTGTIWCLFLAIFSNSMIKKVKFKTDYSKYTSKITGIIFVALGLKLYFQKN